MFNPQDLTRGQKLIFQYLRARKGGTRQNLLDNFQDRVSLCSLNTDLSKLIEQNFVTFETRKETRLQFNQSHTVTVKFYTVCGNLGS
jgi:hypothetical protein